MIRQLTETTASQEKRWNRRRTRTITPSCSPRTGAIHNNGRTKTESGIYTQVTRWDKWDWLTETHRTQVRLMELINPGGDYWLFSVYIKWTSSWSSICKMRCKYVTKSIAIKKTWALNFNMLGRQVNNTTIRLYIPVHFSHEKRL